MSEWLLIGLTCTRFVVIFFLKLNVALIFSWELKEDECFLSAESKECDNENETGYWESFSLERAFFSLCRRKALRTSLLKAQCKRKMKRPWNPLTRANAYSNTTVALFTAKRPRIQPTPRIGISTSKPLIPALGKNVNLHWLVLICSYWWRYQRNSHTKGLNKREPQPKFNLMLCKQNFRNFNVFLKFNIVQLYLDLVHNKSYSLPSQWNRNVWITC